jgi:hypothetical protein
MNIYKSIKKQQIFIQPDTSINLKNAPGWKFLVEKEDTSREKGDVW